MKRTLLLSSFLLVCWFLTGVVPSLAQGPQFNVGQNPSAPTVRGEGLKEKVADVAVATTGTGTISSGTKLNFVYTVGIANASSIGPGFGTNVVCTPAACAANTTVSASGNTLTIAFTGNVTFTAPTDAIRITGIRVNANGLAAGGGVSAAVLPVVPLGGNTVTFQIFNSTSVATVIAHSATATVAAGSLLSCSPSATTAAFTVTVTENFPAAFTSTTDEAAAGGCPTGGCTGTNLVVTISNIPSGLALIVGSPVTTGTPSLTVGPGVATPPAGGVEVVTYPIIKTDTTLIESVMLPFTVTVPSSLPTGLPSVTAVASYSPIPPASNTPLFAASNSLGSFTAIGISDCVTQLLLPWVTNFNVAGSPSSDAHYDTGIVVDNTTKDPFTTGSASAQSGNCVLTMFPNDGTSPITYASGSVSAGVSLQVAASTAFPTKSGYVMGTCYFQNAHAYVHIVNNVGLGAPVTATDYLGLVIPNTALLPRNPASLPGPGGGGLGEALNN